MTRRLKLPLGRLFSHQLQQTAQILVGGEGGSCIPLPVETILSMALQSGRKCALSLRCAPEIISLESGIGEKRQCVYVCMSNAGALTRAVRASHSTTSCDGGRYFNSSLTFRDCNVRAARS